MSHKVDSRLRGWRRYMRQMAFDGKLRVYKLLIRGSKVGDLVHSELHFHTIAGNVDVKDAH